jgi:hypothetical protein
VTARRSRARRTLAYLCTLRACPPRVGPALCTLYGRARNGMPVPGVLLGWHDPVGGDAMSGLVMGFAERRYRDALSMDIVDRGTLNGVRDLSVEYLSNEPEVVYLEFLTRSVIDGHPGRRTICIGTNEAIGTPSGPSRATSGTGRSLRPASSVRRRRRGESRRAIPPTRVVDRRDADVATGAEGFCSFAA